LFVGRLTVGVSLLVETSRQHWPGRVSWQDAIDYAHAVKIDAMRLLGEFLKAAPKNTENAGMGRPNLGSTKKEVPKSQPRPLPETLGKDAHKVSSQAQKLATIAEQGNGLFEEVRSNKRPSPKPTGNCSPSRGNAR